jgi:hypothetical protein
VRSGGSITSMETILSGSNINVSTFIGIALWTLPWMAWSLWLSARRGDIWWFLSNIILNTLGILPIIYIFFIAKQSDVREEKEESTE